MATRPETRPGAARDLDLEQYRRELTGYCYRMLGSGFEAEDAVQETMVRAWRNVERLTTPAALRSWLYRIATNVCFDMLNGAQRRAMPMDLAGPDTADTMLGARLPETTWVLPVPDARVLPTEGDPAEMAAGRETIRLAFVAALQHLPPRQRVVLILREVLRWQATEVAELLETSVASVNSALQRARATLDQLGLEDTSGQTRMEDAEEQELLQRYMDAFERYDIDELVQLLHDDAKFSMPPFALWLEGPAEVEKWMWGQGIGCKDAGLIATRMSGRPAVAIYKPGDDPGKLEAFNIVVLEMRDGAIAELHHFIDPRVFEANDLPLRIDRPDR